MSGTGRADDWYRHDSRAFLEAIQGLGPELIGAYIVLVDLFHARTGNLPRDDRHLSGVMGCSVRKARSLTDQLIDLGKLSEIGGMISEPEAENELKRRRNERETSAKGGRTKHENMSRHKENKDLTATKRREEKRRDKRGSNEPPKDEGWSAHFQDFWEAYPHRGGTKRNRKGAAAAFRKALKAGVTVEQIAAGVVSMHHDPQVSRGYGRDPTSWLNQEGWKDEIPEPSLKILNGGSNEPCQANRTPNRPQDRADPALENIARLAGLGQAPGFGGG